MPEVSIIIPTNRPPEVLDPCLRSIAQQRYDLRNLEVLVVYNGVAGAPHWAAEAWPFQLIVERIEQAHIGAAKNVALERARGEWLILLNDDGLLERGFVAAHVTAHQQLGRAAMVLGRSDWRRYDDETVFDRMIRTTSMIFFYDRMQPHTWYGFRHAWNLNLSLPRCSVGSPRFDEQLGPFFYEDLELAYRLETEAGLGVWYEPRAALVHDHRYTLEGYLQREFAMGQAAPRLWQCNPDCFRATYHAELDQAYLDYCRRFVAEEGRREQEQRALLSRVVARSSSELAATPDGRDELIRLLYHMHLPLKRLAFRRGLSQAMEGTASSATFDAPACVM